MMVFTVYWNPDTDVTEIKYSQRFKYLDGVAKVDVLMDAIADLSEMQNAIMDGQSVIDRVINKRKNND